MDHAAWLESHNNATNAQNARSRKKWKPEPLPETLSDFQRRVADILGMTGGGIYNAPISYDTIRWRHGWNGVSVTWLGYMATFDRGDLTMLVLLCHEARIRLEISPAGPHRLRLSFWQRKGDGGNSQRHPSIDEAVASFREYLPEGHRVRYRALAVIEHQDAVAVEAVR